MPESHQGTRKHHTRLWSYHITYHTISYHITVSYHIVTWYTFVGWNHWYSSVTTTD